MGYMRHHAIVVTTYDRARATLARKEAAAIFGDDSVTGVVVSTVNGMCSFLVPPDGSKEGWDESDAGDERRAKFVVWLDSTRFEDGSSPYAWAEIQYGDDNGETLVTRHSDEDHRWKSRDGGGRDERA